MRPLLLSQIAVWIGAEHHGPELCIEAVTTDSRTPRPGSLFVALRGAHFDGHDFAAAAAQAGAVALLVERRLDSPLPQLQVQDSQQALGRLAGALAASRKTRVIALTGSNGKTTTRSLAQAILARMEGGVYASPGNRNNEIGLPLAVLDQPETATLALYEMGAGAPGDIAYLTGIVQPAIALVTNIAPAHLERMGSLQGVAETKGAIYAALPQDGVAVINADDAFADYFAVCAGQRRVLRYGLDATAQVRALEICEDESGSRFVMQTPAGRVAVRLPLPGRHQISNALAAAALALAAGATLNQIAAGLAEAEGVSGRQQVHGLANGACLIDDSYNANPASLAVAIEALMARCQRDGSTPWLVLGDMRELGAQAAVLHAEAGHQARRAGVVRLFTTGELSRHAAQAFGPQARHFADRRALADELVRQLEPGVTCLVKGSRGSRMDEVVTALRAGMAKEGADAA